ncbi:L-fucose/L-arabinose isomerase family protein [Zongyangia hominis]|uniref:Sugar isomerase n=1 Tax=Zongyangia hominis TaxID=2763677 RepID=A0A926EFQ6_9FIRM|nr:sugar isomerase [Zongyangia hominis]MBC8571236.1 sugar isomerase [Zongyangia hominis]
MYNFRKCTLGVAPTRRDMFLNNCKDAIIERVRELAEKYDVELVTIEGLTEEGLLIDNGDIEKIVRHFRENDVDAVFVPHANFGQEEAVAKLCKAMGKPVLLWGPRDPAPLGVVDQMADRAYDVQCGLFATGKALLSYGVPYTYIENCWIDSPILEKGFDDFIRSVCAAKAFRNARVAQLSVRPWQFLTVRCNESELLEKFGIEVTPIESSELIAAIQGTLLGQKDDIAAKIAGWGEKVDLSAMEPGALEKMAAAVIGIRRVAEEHGCTVMAGECWKMLQAAFGISACFVWGALTDEGMPVTCETDVLGAIGSGVMFGATRGEHTPFFADITVRHPTNDNAELLWHCGPFPMSLAKRGGHPSVIGGKGQWEIEGGDITILRMGADHGRYTMFAGEVTGTEGPKTNGNYIWVETDNWPKWERKLVTGPYIHHVSGAHGKYQAIIHEALRYMGDIHADFIE